MPCVSRAFFIIISNDSVQCPHEPQKPAAFVAAAIPPQTRQATAKATKARAGSNTSQDNPVISAVMVLSGMLFACVCCNVTKACVSYVCVLVWRVKRKPLTTSSLKHMAALMPTVICRVCAGRAIRRRRPVNGLSDNNSQLSEGRGGSNLCDLTSSGLPAPSFFYTREK